MSPISITTISLIILGFLLCVGAIIYTKVIKPNDFGYSSKNSFINRNYINTIKKINSVYGVRLYENISLNIDNKYIVFNRILISKQNSYILTNAIEKKCIDVVFKNNKIKLIYSKKELDLPLDVNLDISNSKILKKSLHDFKQNIILIVPVRNKNFISKKINNFLFINEKDIFNKIKILEEESFNSFDWNSFIKKIDGCIVEKMKKKKFNFK